MWVFGYGSLMWDNWEEEFFGNKHPRAVLHGYSRAFNKKSVKNWGTTEKPGPTLGLEKRGDAQCVGIAFEFPEIRQDDILEYLGRREGKSFNLEQLEIELLDGQRVEAYTPVNDQTKATFIKDLDTYQLVEMVRISRGTSGKCSDYVINLRGQLIYLGITDEAVENLWKPIINEETA